jgi:hypothetical protein
LGERQQERTLHAVLCDPNEVRAQRGRANSVSDGVSMSFQEDEKRFCHDFLILKISGFSMIF